MNIHKLRVTNQDAPGNAFSEAVFNSIKNEHKARFGWCYKGKKGKNRFLTRIKKEDWLIYVTVNERGRCIACKVSGDYFYDKNDYLTIVDGYDDCWHGFPIDDWFEFNWNDEAVHPNLSKRIKGVGRGNQIHGLDNEFDILLNHRDGNTIKNVEKKETETKNIHFLKKETNEELKKLTSLIQNSYPGKDLERFMAEVFRRIEGVEHVKENGFGWKSDEGADLIVSIKSPVSFLSVESVDVVIQIKSYVGEQLETNAVKQIKKGIEKFGAISGMLITTAAPTEVLIDKIEEVSQEIKKPIELIAGEDVAKFVLKHAPDLIFDLDVS